MLEVSIILHWGAVVFYLFAATLYLLSLSFRPEGFRRGGYLLAAGGLFVHTLAIACRWYVTGHGPYYHRYEVFSSNVWIAVALFLLVSRFYPFMQGMGFIIMPAAVLLLGAGVLASPEIKDLPASFQSIWLVVHVYFSKLAYGSALLGTACAAVLLLKGRFSWQWLARMPEEKLLDSWSYRLIKVAFFAIAVMIVSGAIWANQAWGRYWSWDPVETWSLISWLIYAAYLHLYSLHGWRGRRGAWFAVFALVVLLFLIYGLGYIYESVHSIYLE